VSRPALLGLLGLVFGWGACERGGSKTAEHADATPVVVVEKPGTPPESSDEPAPPEQEEETLPGRVEIVMTDVACVQDSDCVKDSCCHATTCVAASARPDCSSVACTADCRAGTMDCNGGCLCQAGKCASKLWWPPSE
jgi:hypothetical protein